jgi:hypothetical protein
MGFVLYSFYGYFIATLGAIAIYVFESPVFKVAGLVLPFVALANSWMSYYVLHYHSRQPVPGGQAYVVLPSDVAEA